MIKDLIIRNVERDIEGLRSFIIITENVEGTTVPPQYYISAVAKTKVHNGAMLATIFATTMAGSNPNFKNVDFSNDISKTIHEYCKHIEAPLQTTQLEYQILFDNSFSIDEFINEVLSFKTLQNNWDGYGAIPSGVKCTGKVISLAYKLPSKQIAKISEVFPNPNGTVTLEWENHSGERLVAEVGKNTFSYYVKLNSFDPKFYNEVLASDEGIYELSQNIKKLFI